MAESPSHKFGQIVGNLLEDLLYPILKEFCDQRGLYLDIKGNRIGVRNGKKVTWSDKYGNKHDLDFVIEKDGAINKKGRPVAFIEAAWRRYTKHSRNKVQEIQGAILPISDEYEWDKPFLGAVLAGEFTKGSLDQLRSVGFHVLYFPYNSIVAAFNNIGIDVQFDESTPDSSFEKCIKEIESLSDRAYNNLRSYLGEQEKNLFEKFLKDLSAVLDRIIEKLIVVPLFGSENTFSSISEAMNFVQNYKEKQDDGPFRKYEIIAKYSNGDTIDAFFHNKHDTEKFLRYLGS